MGLLIGLAVLGIVIFLHELGHFLAAKALGVPAPLFSIGFGPKLFGFQWKDTEYRLSAIPLGGYVLFGRGENFEVTGAIERIIIFAAGPLANFLTALAIYQSVPEFGEKFSAVIGVVGQLFTGQIGVNQLSGPLGIMNVAGKVAETGLGPLMQFIAFLSINLGVLNLLPLPILDGGQILIAMAEGITRRQINMKVRIAAALLCWGLFILLVIQVTIGDISHLTKAAKAPKASIENVTPASSPHQG